MLTFKRLIWVIIVAELGDGVVYGLFYVYTRTRTLELLTKNNEQNAKYQGTAIGLVNALGFGLLPGVANILYTNVVPEDWILTVGVTTCAVVYALAELALFSRSCCCKSS